MNANLERDEVIVHGPGDYSEEIGRMARFGSNVAIIAVCDTYLSGEPEKGDYVSDIHDYYVYAVPSPLEDYLSETKSLLEKAILNFLKIKAGGIKIRVVWHRINVIRVQVVFGKNQLQPEMARIICQRALEISASGK